MAGFLKALSQKRVVIISGKGGVGKTTVALALAHYFSKIGKKILLVEMNSTERIAPFFSKTQLGYKETELTPNIFGININPVDSFYEYIQFHVPLGKLMGVFLKNHFVADFLHAIPGVDDILVVGKIYDLERKPDYDMVIVDSPATGHGVSAFEVPFILNRLSLAGPLKTQSEKVVETLTNPEKTVFCPVTFAEEMPVAETIELINLVQKKIKIALGPVFFNRYMPPFFSVDESKKWDRVLTLQKSSLPEPYVKTISILKSKVARNELYLKQLKEGFPQLDFVLMPQLEEEIKTPEDLELLLR